MRWFVIGAPYYYIIGIQDSIKAALRMRQTSGIGQWVCPRASIEPINRACRIIVRICK